MVFQANRTIVYMLGYELLDFLVETKCARSKDDASILAKWMLGVLEILCILFIIL